MMKKYKNKYLINLKKALHYIILCIPVMIVSCEEFYEPDQELVIKSDDMFNTWDEYRSAELGLYSLQQNLVDQLVILGELRADLLKVTPNATPALKEIYNFSISRTNPYASPVNFYKLIAACNNLIQNLESTHPEVLDKNAETTNYDRIYGEALCMEAWAYFNAVRIYKKVPYIYPSLTQVEEIENYVNSGGRYIDSIHIDFAPNGYDNDTIRDTTFVLQKKFLDLKAVIDTFTFKLENKIKAVGVNHSIDNNDITWNTTIWNTDAKNVLLGQLYFYDGNYQKAMKYFNTIILNKTKEGTDIKYGLSSKFKEDGWKQIFQNIDSYEHIFTLSFSKRYRQTNNLQTIFSSTFPNKYMVKPTALSIRYWESMWEEPDILFNDDPTKTEMLDPGEPGDFFRGYGVSYKYFKNGNELSVDTVKSMLTNKLNNNFVSVRKLMENVDTVVNKYSIGKSPISHDANFIVYRAAGIHLYAAEIYALWYFDHSGIIRPETNTSINILNDGTYSSESERLGVRGRVGFADGYEAVRIPDIIYRHDPVTNAVIGHYNFRGNLAAKQEYLIEKILEERARELAFEGERFYDLIRIAKRRNDPAYLADKVSAKFDGPDRQYIRSLLLDENNWYINYY